MTRAIRNLICMAWSLVWLLGAPGVRADDSQPIDQHRKGSLLVRAAPGTEVRVEQLRHEFWFGAALASHVFSGQMDVRQAEKYKQMFLENFNAAVTENALKWHAMERRQARWTTRLSTRSWRGRTSTTFPARPQHLLGRPEVRAGLGQGAGR